MITCSFDAGGEQLAGTAPTARAWIVVEQPGPWGRDALTDSALDPRVAEHLSRGAQLGVSALLARRPERARLSLDAGRHVWVARTSITDPLLRHGLVGDLDELLEWDLASLATGQVPEFGRVIPEPVTFVCTHSKRDRCCAVEGRALFSALTDAAGPQATIWECSHVGGHRFAPVLLSLPRGAVHGRLDVRAARAVLSAAAVGEVVPEFLRGMSALAPAEQSAAVAVMRLEGLTRPDDLEVRTLSVTGGTADVLVLHRDRRRWRTRLRYEPLPDPRKESCAKEPVPAWSWVCTSLELLQSDDST